MRQLNVLLVSYSFPPAGGVGVLRAASLARYLPAHNIHVDVLTTRNASAVGSDSSLLDDLPPEVTIRRTTTLDIPFALKKAIKKRIADTSSITTSKSTAINVNTSPRKPNFMKRIVRDLLLPDPQVTWLPILTRAAKQMVKTRNIDVVIITVPPFSSALLAARLRKQFPKLHIVVDFRDEWLSTTIDLVSFSRSDHARKIAQESEAEAVANADLIVAVTNAARREIRSRYPGERENKFQFVSNGYDASKLALLPSHNRAKNEKVVVTYVGTIYGSTNPLPLVEAFHALPDAVRSRLHLVFIGHMEEPRFREALTGLGSIVEMKGYLPQKEALAVLSRSDYALLITHDALNISAKFYDYAGARKPILALLNPAGACRSLMEELHAGWWADINDIPQICQLFTDAVMRVDRLAADFHPNDALIAQYERQVLAGRYAELLHSLGALAAARAEGGLMKIAVVTRYFPSSAEPWQGRSAYQTLRLIAPHARVKVFYPNASYPALLSPKSRIYGKLDAAFRPPDVDTSYHDYAALPLISRPVNGWAAARKLLPHVRSFGPDLIFSVFLYPAGYSALKIGKALSVPTVAMGIGSDINQAGDGFSAKRTRQVLRESSFTITVSEDLRRKAVTLGAPAAKTRAILNGCDTSVFRPSDRRDARWKLRIDSNAEAVVYIGRMDVKKGLLELVEAAAALHSSHPRLEVYLVGEGPDRANIEAASASKGAMGFIHCLPACSADDVAVWMTAADLVTLPSYMEGCPNVVLEALACGRPVVATNVGGIPEIMNEDCGRLVPSHDSEALAAGLDAVLRQSWDADSLSLHWSRSWDSVAAELFEVFESVVTSHEEAAGGS